MPTLKRKIKNRVRHMMFYNDRKRLNNKNFTIISNNCWGGNVSTDFNVQHHSPFVGMFIYTDDYLKLCRNLEYYLAQDLEFLEYSRRDPENVRHIEEGYPIALLGDIELNLQHYKSKEEAVSKWNRRRERINWDNLYFKLDENYGATPEDLKEFDNLPYDNIVIMTEKEYPELKHGVYFKDFSLKSRMEQYRRYFDVVEWLNTGKIINTGTR